MRWLPDSLGVLRGRSFRLLFAAHATSLLGDGMGNIALAFAVLEVADSASAIGLVLACRTLLLLVCLLLGGVIADRITPRPLMVAADLTRFASQGALAAFLIIGDAQLWIIAVLAGITGAATGCFNPASTGLLPTVVARDDLQAANGLRSTAMAAGEVAGPLLAGVLIASVGAGWALALDAVTFLVSLFLLLRVEAPARSVVAPETFLSALRTGWRTVWAFPWAMAFVAAVAVGNLLFGAWAVLGPVVADGELGGAAAWGAILSCMGVGGVIGGVLAIRFRPRRPLVAGSAAGAVLAIPLMILALGAPVTVLAVAALTSGAAMMFGNAVWESTLQAHIPPHALARVSAYDWFGSLAFAPVGLALWGPVSAVVGVDIALWVAFGLTVMTALALLTIPSVRDLGPASAVGPSDSPADRDPPGGSRLPQAGV